MGFVCPYVRPYVRTILAVTNLKHDAFFNSEPNGSGFLTIHNYCGRSPFGVVKNHMALYLLVFFSLFNSSELEYCCKGRGVGHLSSSDLSNVYLCGIGRSHMDG